MIDYREFMRILRGEPGRATLFEPFPDRKIISQLIWRGGDHLWDTPEHRVSTLIDFYAYIKSDVAIIEAGDDIDAVLGCSHLLPDKMKFVIVSDDMRTLAIADASDSVCAAATSQCEKGGFKKPLIYLLRRDDDFDRVCDAGFAGIYVPSEAEGYLERPNKIAILGGLGTGYINASEPLEIHGRIKRLHENSRGAWAVGSGGFGEAAEYLGFISMLGAYNKLL